jgi:NADP-dependent 3-hydroxy acid dehydrogenase YdfG
MKKQEVWFITGTSKGFGEIFVRQLIQKGYLVAGTSQKLSDLDKLASEMGDRFLPLSLELTKEKSVDEAIEKVMNAFGRIDVVVNNAGYVVSGAIEELSDSEVRKIFDVNVFGTLNVLRKTLPFLRAQKSGHIFNFSSIAGFFAMYDGYGIYNATKFAVQGLTETLNHELKPLGIGVTDVVPGYFRTNLLSAGSLNKQESMIDAYSHVHKAIEETEKQAGKQPNDPKKGVAVIINAYESGNPPAHLLLGEDAYQMADQKISALKADMDEWEPVATKTQV